MTRVRAQAIVDRLSKSWWRVGVRCVDPPYMAKDYTLMANTDNEAAFKGLQMFTDEVEALKEG